MKPLAVTPYAADFDHTIQLQQKMKEINQQQPFPSFQKRRLFIITSVVDCDSVLAFNFHFIIPHLSNYLFRRVCEHLQGK